MRELADRQEDERHSRVLERAAEAIIPGGEGRLAEEIRYSLAADVLLGATHTGTVPVLHPGERLALVAVLALTAALPGCALGDLARELTLLADELDAATTAGRTATAGTPTG